MPDENSSQAHAMGTHRDGRALQSSHRDTSHSLTSHRCPYCLSGDVSCTSLQALLSVNREVEHSQAEDTIGDSATWPTPLRRVFGVIFQWIPDLEECRTEVTEHEDGMLSDVRDTKGLSRSGDVKCPPGPTFLKRHVPLFCPACEVLS